MGLLLAAIVLLALAAVLVLVHGVPASAPVQTAAPRPAAMPTISPREFEQHCADALAARGWSVTVGRGSADQGIDVLARKGGRKVVLQCKLWNRPVGNKAVQEALAGQGYAGADGAAVVSNATYTASAHALAARVGVLLLHTSDLARADTLFVFPPRDGARPAVAEEPVRAQRRRARPAVGRGWRPVRLLARLSWPPISRPRLPWPLVPAAVLAGLILFLPRHPPGPDETRREARRESPRPALREALPLPPPAPPARRAAG